jgi:hypothetical protein
MAGTEPPDRPGLRLDPSTACAYLADAGLDAQGDYHATGGGAYACASAGKTLLGGSPVHHEIRYIATGGAEAVDSLVLELSINSVDDVQRAHETLVERAEQLLDLALGVDLPEAARQAILAGAGGRWTVDGSELVVARRPSRARLYALRLQIR